MHCTGNTHDHPQFSGEHTNMHLAVCGCLPFSVSVKIICLVFYTWDYCYISPSLHRTQGINMLILTESFLSEGAVYLE